MARQLKPEESVTLPNDGANCAAWCLRGFSGYLPGFWQFYRMSLLPALRCCLCHRCLYHRWGRDWLINEGVRRRIRPGHDIANKTERQVRGAEHYSSHLSMLLRLCLPKTRYILSYAAERAPPTLLGMRVDQVCNGPASRD